MNIQHTVSQSRHMVALIAVIFALVGACSESGEQPGASGGGGGSTPAYAGTVCDQCDREACASERASCGAEPGCAGYLACLGKCATTNGDADPACEANCVGTQTPESATLTAFRSCRTSGAGTTCPDCPRQSGADGGVGLCTPPAFLTQQCAPSTDSDPCGKCQREKCCQSIQKIFTPGPNRDLSECWLACEDALCESGCFGTFPEGVAAHAEYEACVFTQCGQPTGPCPVQGTCSQCRYDKCECEYATCAANTDCFLATNCFSWCEDVNCINNCLALYPNRNPEYDAQITCWTQRCGDQC